MKEVIKAIETLTYVAARQAPGIMEFRNRSASSPAMKGGNFGTQMNKYQGAMITEMN